VSWARGFEAGERRPTGGKGQSLTRQRAGRSKVEAEPRTGDLIRAPRPHQACSTRSPTISGDAKKPPVCGARGFEAGVPLARRFARPKMPMRQAIREWRARGTDGQCPRRP
jgi:hypothetical protein